MADTKITALDALSSAAREDLIALVDDPSVTPINKKITVANFLDALSTTLAALGVQPDVADEYLVLDADGPTLKTVTYQNAGHFVPLPEPLTNTAFDGDSFSAVAAHTKIENTSWSTAIPADAKAVAISIIARDSASAGAAGYHFKLFATSSATNPALTCYLGGIPNDCYATIAGTIPCTNGDLWYECNASGANTLDIWLRVTGYWI
jgi:hypothetical protein